MKWLQIQEVSIDLVEQLENTMSIKLPKDYKDFIVKHDGGYPVPNHFNIGEKEEVFNNLISLDKEEYDNIYEVVDSLGNRLENTLFPFAEDPFGNLLCFDYSDNQNVVFWEHEKNNEEYTGTQYVCDNFSDLIKMLY